MNSKKASRPQLRKRARARSAPHTAQTDEPRYLQIARELKRDIATGVYPVGSLLPTEEELAKRHAVSRNTVREALRQLRQDNLISSRRGIGTVVVPPQSSDSNFVHAMSINDVLSFSNRWDFSIKSIDMDVINGSLGAWLGVANDREWLAVRGVSRTRGATSPECWVEFYINREFASVGRLLRHHSGPLVTLIEDMFGQKVTQLNQDISAALIPPELAAELEVEPGTPAILVRRACRTADDNIVEANIEIYPASRFRYSVTLHRAKKAPRDG